MNLKRKEIYKEKKRGLKTMTNTLIKKHHDYLYNSFDLGSSLEIVITIQDDKAIITNSGARIWGEQFDITEIGKAIAETILLNGLNDSIQWGDWLHNADLKPVNQVLEMNEDNFELDLEFVKLWSLTRTVSNMKREANKIYEISYFAECGEIYYQEMTIEQYKDQLDNWGELD